MHMLDLTKTYAKVFNQKRKLYYDKNITLKCLNVNTVLVELFDNWFLDPKSTNELASGEDYLELVIADIKNELDFKLKVANSFEIQGARYKKVQLEFPTNGVGTKVWRFRVAPTGEQHDS